MLKTTVRNELVQMFEGWRAANNIEALPVFSIDEPPKGLAGDLASNLAMLSAKPLGKNPRALADELVAIINSTPSEIIGHAAVAGPGFVNIFIKNEYLFGQLARVLKEKERFGSENLGLGKNTLIEFVSSNPTGPLHIGHGRGAAIGDSLARVFSFMGYKVLKEYYVNDLGNQIEKLGLSLEARYKELQGERPEFPEDGYRGAYLIETAKKLAGEHRKEIDFRAYALNEMMASIKGDLERFDVSFDNWFFESDLSAKKNARGSIEETCEFLVQKGFAYEQEGALWFASTKFGDDKDRVLKRGDGRFTYLASDIAYHKNKLDRGFELLMDLWGADHHGYVPRMKAAISALGSDPEKLKLILYQLVALVRAGKPVAMSTRAGEFVTLTEVVNEVGTDACRFFFLLRAPDSPLDFDLELAKKRTSENPVFYVQYVHARCFSIFRESKTKSKEISPANIELSLLSTPEERNLIKKLVVFSDTLELCIRTTSPHHLTTYLLGLADLFHVFYEKCRVLTQDEKLTATRLTLVEAVATVIRTGLGLLGVSAPQKM
jgi:arginyl-tRNA synthetase